MKTFGYLLIQSTLCISNIDIFQKLITIYNNMGLQCTISFVLRHKLQILQSDRTITIRTYLIPILGD